ncbi:pyridoxal phosphate-dependent aminotransferase [Formicincola oecophyllae]|uniref:Aminotransferase n=1 Tax=Formicincola oecophyllae TaxID=2558361 RepID=A0A4Y6UAV8_9PROT|nr:pyridoxal phosphate-dependent aminotransferase [Formicincola oecophyllae]QDH14274.1 pyridoxal phosphate-dependent aminotransferase [Formicincola oecophyllae]
MGRIQPSQTIAMSQKARALQSAGADVISLSAGEPDFPTPRHVCDAAIEAIRAGDTKYTDIAGTRSTRAVLAQWLKNLRGLDYGLDEIIICTGGKQVIYNAMTATLNAGDEVIIPAPAWVSYPDIALLSGGKPVVVPCAPSTGYKLTPQALEATVTPRSKWLVLNSPSNPTGAVYSAGELRALADVLARHPQLWIMSDDIYGQLAYGPQWRTGPQGQALAPNILQVAPELKNRTLIVDGASKAYAMTGWRMGFGAGPQALIKAMVKLQGQSTSNSCSIAQAAAKAAFEGPQNCVADMAAAYEKRRDLVVASLEGVPGLACLLPEGAFYVFLSVGGMLGQKSSQGRPLNTDHDVAEALLEEAGVATVPGSAFMAPGHIRLSYATSDENLRQACARIKAFCQAAQPMKA